MGISDFSVHCSGTGIDGVAVVSALFAKPDIKTAAKNLYNLSNDMVKL